MKVLRILIGVQFFGSTDEAEVLFHLVKAMKRGGGIYLYVYYRCPYKTLHDIHSACVYDIAVHGHPTESDQANDIQPFFNGCHSLPCQTIH